MQLSRGAWFGVITGIIGVLGTIFTVWSYFSGQRARIPTFYVEPTRSTIVDASNNAANDLTVSFQGQPIKGMSVTSIQVYFWNKGKEPIRSGDVLQPLEISLPATVRLLSAHIVGKSRDICDFRLLDSGDPNKVRLGFTIAERNDGVRIQLTYAGRTDAVPGFSGIVVDANEPVIERTKSKGELGFNAWPSRRAYWVGVIVSVVLSFAVLLPPLLKTTTTPIDKFVLPVSVLMIFIMESLLIYQYLIQSASVPTALLQH